MPLRIVFMGTPDFSVPSLVELAGHGHEIVACYSQPPRPAGRRGLELRKSPVHEMAEQLGIPVHTPVSLRDVTEQEVFAAHDADVAVVIAYGLILPEQVLNAPRLGCYNGHASLLPRWRGAAPIQRAIMAGDQETGVCIMKMDQGLDTGPVALEERIAIGADMTASELHDRLSRLNADLMVRTMAALERGSLKLTPQPDSGIEYASKISKEETRINWDLPAKQVHDHIRALSPFPGAWCEMRIGDTLQRVKVLSSQEATGNGTPGERLEGDLVIACGEGAVNLLRVQRAGKQAQDADEFIRGTRVKEVI
ncbi:MAG: methionyl-tRNA formyltransferase [Pseudomonadota bacterium]